ncbi:uncharacterized protein [Littorina saxatilis]|uniref:uncharacterized protein n=1 Tax=Littorina saxatilis TaxID=31220 RepID=UPI0038B5A2DD
MDSFQNGNVKLQRYSTTTEPRTPTASSPTSPTSPNGHGGLPILSPNNLSFTDDDVFFDEKLKENNNDLPHFAPPPRTPGTAPSPDVMWSQRKLRLRHVIVVAVLVVSLILLAVGVGLAIVFTQNVSSEPTPTSPPLPCEYTFFS